LAVVVRVAVVALVDFVDFVVLLETRKWMLSSVNFVSATVLLFLLFRDSQSPRQLLGYKM
jgi:hypothetical protein